MSSHCEDCDRHEMTIADLRQRLEFANKTVAVMQKSIDSLGEQRDQAASRLQGVLDGVRWVISDMGYCPPELALQQGIVWHAKLSSLVVEKRATICGAYDPDDECDQCALDLGHEGPHHYVTA